MFQSAMLVGVEAAIELNRTVYGILRYDLSALFCPDWRPKLDQYLKLVTSRYTYAKTMADFSKEFARLVGEFGLITDAFYANQPFYFPIYRAFAYRFIALIRTKFQKIWNELFDSIGAGDCLALSDSMVLFLGTLEKWGLKEEGLRAYYRPLVLKFTQCLFNNSREVMANIMDQMVNTRNVVNGKVQSTVFSNLEAHVNFVLDHYSKFPSPFFAKEILVYISNVLAIFLLRILDVLNKNETNGRLFIMILNANMIKVIRNTERKIMDLAGKHIKLQTIRDGLVEHYLIKRIAAIFSKANQLLRRYFKDQVIAPGFAKNTPYLSFDFRKHLDKIIFEANHNLTLLSNETLLRESFQYVFERTFKDFAKFYLRHLHKLIKTEFVVSAAKVKSDLGYFRNFCIDDILENGYLMRKHLDSFIDILNAPDVSLIIVGFINLQISFPKIFNGKNVSKIIKARMNDEKALRTYVKKHIQKEEEHTETGNRQMMFQVKEKRGYKFLGLTVLYFFVILSELTRCPSRPSPQKPSAGPGAVCLGQGARGVQRGIQIRRLLPSGLFFGARGHHPGTPAAQGARAGGQGGRLQAPPRPQVG